VASDFLPLLGEQPLAALLSAALPAWLLRFAPVLVSVAATYLLHSTLLLGSAWLCVRGGRLRSEALKERLWKLAAVLPLCTAPLQLVLDVSPPTFELARGRAAIVRETAPLDPPGTTQSESVDASGPSEPTHAESMSGNVSPPIAAELREMPTADPNDVPPTAIAADGPPIVLSDGVDAVPATAAADPLFVWIGCGLVGLVGFGIARLVVQSLLFARCLRGCTEVRDPSVRRMLDEIARLARVRRRFRLLVSPMFRQPAAFGLLRWTIIVPEEVLRTFEPAELRGLLAHEAAHLVRGDAAWLWVGRILCACFAIQPLNFVARRAWRCSAEILCDEWAVSHSANGLALARCLTHIAALNSPTAPRLQALWALGAVSRLGERVERLLNGTPVRDAWNTHGRARLVTLAAAAIASLFVCAAPRTTVLAGAGGAVADGNGERVAFASLSASERATATALGQELRQLHGEIEAVIDLAETRRPGDARVVELARRIAGRATQLHDRYQRLTLTSVTPADHSSAGRDRADLSKGAEP
jgi:beta-lactamase regulating signal transducer with metallopeptidase domain